MKYFTLILICFGFIQVNSQASLDTVIVYDSLIPGPWLKPNSAKYKKAYQQYYLSKRTLFKHTVRSEVETFKSDHLSSDSVITSYSIEKKTSIQNNYSIRYLKYFVEDSIIAYEGLQNMNRFIGPYKSYHQNGNLKLSGNYSNFKFKKSGKIKKQPLKQGTWIHYSKKGKLLRKIKYKDGKVIR
tara:strand:- start:973 stop:1524 length:552 start_codon:yes stop_codon:yes gene_type:complete